MIEQIANRHNMAVARRSLEATKKLTTKEFIKLLDSAYHFDVIGVFDDYDHAFSVLAFEPTDSDSAVELGKAIIALIQSKVPFSLHDGGDTVFLLGAKGSKLDNVDSFVAVVNKHQDLVNALIEIGEQ